MLSAIIVRPRSEFEGLFLDLHSYRFRFRVTGSGRHKVAKEIRHVFGRYASAAQLAEYFYHPARVAWEVAHAEPGNYVDTGQSEILDHTFWPCRDMFFALAGTEPAELNRMLLASVTATALDYDLSARERVPASFGEAVDLFKCLARGASENEQERIAKVYEDVKASYDALSKKKTSRELKQPMRVIRLVLSYFSTDFADLGDSLPWFNLMEIVYAREHVGMGRHVPIRPILTPTDLASITQMLLGVDTTRLTYNARYL